MHCTHAHLACILNLSDNRTCHSLFQTQGIRLNSIFLLCTQLKALSDWMQYVSAFKSSKANNECWFMQKRLNTSLRWERFFFSQLWECGWLCSRHDKVTNVKYANFTKRCYTFKVDYRNCHIFSRAGTGRTKMAFFTRDILTLTVVKGQE